MEQKEIYRVCNVRIPRSTSQRKHGKCIDSAERLNKIKDEKGIWQG